MLLLLLYISPQYEHQHHQRHQQRQHHFFIVTMSFETNDLVVTGLMKPEIWQTNNRPKLGGSPGLVVMGRDSHSEGCGFESQHRILDGHFLHIFVVKIVMMFV